jgi:hypothetical protein
MIRSVTSAGVVSFLAGSAIGAAGSSDGTAASASFNWPVQLTVRQGFGEMFVADTGNSRIRRVTSTGITTTIAGSATGYADAVGTNAYFHRPSGAAPDTSGNLFATDCNNNRVRKIATSGVVTTFAGSGGGGFINGIGTAAAFSCPSGIAVDAALSRVFIADHYNNVIRLVLFNGTVSTYAGNGAAAFADGAASSASFNLPFLLALAPTGLFVTDVNNHRIRSISNAGLVSTVAGGVAGFSNGFGLLALFNTPTGITSSPSGRLFVSDCSNHRIRQLTCVPCPASYYCSSGTPVLCPAGSYCPLSSANALLCTSGSYSNAGASSCTLCPAGTFTSAPGSASCQQCPGGHFCPTGTSSWARLNCGKGSYCPDGSGAPIPCPYQVPPTGAGWGALQVQGPAFLVETAHCLNHCFWNFTSGDGMLSKC